jgi:hypothetical protein
MLTELLVIPDFLTLVAFFMFLVNKEFSTGWTVYFTARLYQSGSFVVAAGTKAAGWAHSQASNALGGDPSFGDDEHEVQCEDRKGGDWGEVTMMVNAHSTD